MNVLNRKMFSNRDARKKLAGMGGILSSSPELMGTAQRFQEGGQGNAEQEFIVNIPGFSPPGEMLRITESTLAQLTELVPELLSQKDTLVAPVEMLANVESRPGDAVVSTRLRRMFEAPAEQTSVSENLTLDSEAMANRAAAASMLGQQLSDLTLMPERTPGELEIVVEGEDQRAAEAATRRRIAEEDMAMAVPVPRDDFRTFPVDMPLTRDEQILADAQAAIKKYDTNAGRDTAGNLLPVAPDSDLTRAIEQRNRDEAASGPMIVERSTAADPFGPEALAARAAMQERENQERLSIDAKLDTQAAAAAAQEEAAAQLSADRLAATAGFVGEDEPTTTDYSTLNNSDLETLLSLNPRNPNAALLDEILRRSTPRRDSTVGIDSDAGADLSPDMVARLNRLEKLRTARDIADKSNPVGNFLEGANLVGGAITDTGLALGQLGLGGLGYISGGGGISDLLFSGSEAAGDLRQSLRDDGKNFAPRIYNPETEEEQAEAKLKAIKQNSIDAIMGGNDLLFSDPQSGQGVADRLPQGSVGEMLIASNDQAAADEAAQRPSRVDPLIASNNQAAADEVAQRPSRVDPLSGLLAANEEFSQRPDTQDPLTDERLIDIVTSAIQQPAQVLEQPAVQESNETVGSGFSLAPAEDSTLGRLIEQGKQFGQDVYDTGSEFLQSLTGPDAEVDQAVAEAQVEDAKTDAEAQVEDAKTDAEAQVEDAETDAEAQVEDAETDSSAPPKSLRPKLRPEEIIKKGSAAELADTVTENPDDPNGAAATAILDRAGVDTTGMDIKERTVAMRKVLSDLMGDTPDDEKNEFWMNMAMMGFAVAAGESPDALKNIADGLLAGTAQIQQGKAARKERGDKMTLTAFGEVLADQRATEKFGRDLAVAKVRAAGADNKYNAARERSRLKEQIIKTPFDYPKLLDDSGTLDPTKLNEYLDLVVNAANETDEEIIVTEDQARAEFKKVVEQRPDLREAMLQRMKKQGFNTEGL